MEVVRFHRYGGPEVLAVEQVPIPEPKAGEILIRVSACGVNYADVMKRRNMYPEPTPLPYVPGGEVAGVIEAVGPGVAGVGPGTFGLAALAGGGGYAQYVAVPARYFVPLPAAVDPASATALFVQGVTADLILKESARLQKGESVLVQAAAGGVGLFAVQIAKQMGAGRVIAAASSAEKIRLAESFGADTGVNYTQGDWPQQVRKVNGGRGVDVILEMSGGSALSGDFECMAPFGRLVVYGLASGQSATFDPQRLLGPCQSVIGFYLGQFFSKPQLIQASVRELIEKTLQGRLKIHVGHRLPLRKAAEAHRLLEARQSMGKIALNPWATD